MKVQFYQTEWQDQVLVSEVTYENGEVTIEGSFEPELVLEMVFGDNVPEDPEAIMGALMDCPRRFDGMYLRASVVMQEGGDGSGWFAPPRGTHGKGSQGGPVGPGESTFAATVASRKVTSRSPVYGGVTDPTHLVYKNGVEATWKEHGAAGTFHDGYSEVAAYELSRLLHPDAVVPEAVNHEMQGMEGTVQRWIPGESGDAVMWEDRERVLNAGENQSRLETLVALDVIMNNTDRHDGNWIIGEDDKVWAIDHGHAQWQGRGYVDDIRMHRSPVWGMRVDGPGISDRNRRGESATTYRIRDWTLDRWRQISYDDFAAAILPQIERSARVSASSQGSDHYYSLTRVNVEDAWSNFNLLLDYGEIQYGY